VNKNSTAKGAPQIIAPDPYLGRTLLYSLDVLIPVYMNMAHRGNEWVNLSVLS